MAAGTCERRRRPILPSTSSTRALTSVSRERRCQNEYLYPAPQRTAQRRFSYTERLLKRFVTWKLRERPLRLISYGLKFVTSSPFRRMAPEVSGKRPEIRL